MKTAPKERILRFLTANVLVAVIVVISFGAKAQTDSTKSFVVDKIIAKVDNFILLKSELESTYQSYISSGNPASEKEKCALLNKLVINKLMVAKAEIDSVLVTDAEVDNTTDQRMAYLLQNDGNSQEVLEKRWGKTMGEIKIELREQIREQLLGREMQQKITKDITITPAEVKRFIGKVPVDSLPFYSSDIEVAQIVKVAKVSNEQNEKVRARLLDIRQQIIAGADWGEMARKYSEDPSAIQNAGEMGKVPRGAMVSEYEAMAFRLQQGEISQPFSSTFGFHIMQLIERSGNEYTSRHILIMATPSKDDLQRATRFLDSLRRKILADSIKFGDAAKFLSDDKSTKDHGGFLTDPEGGTRISMESVDFPIYEVINGMKVGDISQPVPYRTEDKKEAMRIIWKKAQIKPHKANLGDDWFRLQAGALAEKKDKALEKWFTKARGDVFISIDPVYKGCKILD